jgi:hypothetical protein
MALCRILNKILGSGNMSMMDHAISVATKNFSTKSSQSSKPGAGNRKLIAGQ